ncbi:MAG: circularly permuted type 2 ATP-grasp protein [Amphiplicatus sp.]
MSHQEISGREAGGQLIGRYRPPAGVADELLDPTGAVRPAWRRFISHLATLSPENIAQRFARGDQYLRDAGVFYRQYDKSGSTERAWPLSHVPVMIHESEWRKIEAGLIQRANLLEAVAADLYGSNRLVAEGRLPASLIAMSPEWLRPLVGVRPRSGYFLNFIAFEIGRGPDGQWWVLGDRTQAPSGAGFALENRVATSRVFSDLIMETNTHRLAGFFRAFRDSLNDMRGDASSRVAILTPGPMNETYFEHAYIARYLGFMLLEGEDLVVENDKVMVRTVAGLEPVSVLWRRLDAAYIDPLELNERSQLGTPGLLSAVRHGNVSMVNALGAGVLETRALLAFLPRICEAMFGEPLLLPNIATWWCGQPVERAYVEANVERMMLASALSTKLSFDTDETIALGKAIRKQARQSLDALLDAEGALLVGQEAVTLSTSPAYVAGRLAPRPMSLRVFLARSGEGWQVMPGGFARIGRTKDAAAIAMQRGGSVADVWIVGDTPIAPDTMLPAPSAPIVRVRHGALPSRAADNLFWLGRYVERAEGVMRLLRAYHVRLSETADAKAPLLKNLAQHLRILNADPRTCIPAGLRDTLASAIGAAGKVRDQFSVDGWMALRDLDKTARNMIETVTPGDDASRAMGVLLRKITGFSGLVHENMYRFTGWRFLSIGRSLERAGSMASALARFADPGAPDGALDLIIEVGDSVMSHRRRYAVASGRNTVIDLLALDVNNPRSILYHMTEIRDHVAFLPGSDTYGQMSTLSRAVLQTHTGLAVRTPDKLDTDTLKSLGGAIADLSDLLTVSYLR